MRSAAPGGRKRGSARRQGEERRGRPLRDHEPQPFQRGGIDPVGSPPACAAWPTATGPTSRRSWAPGSTATGGRRRSISCCCAASGTRPTRRTSRRSARARCRAIYEYESLLAELVDLDVVSASHYDGAAATAEAALMTCRATRRDRVLISRGVHPALPPDDRDLPQGPPRARRDPAGRRRPAAGTTDLAALERMLADTDRPVAGVIAAQPDFLGLLEPMPEIGRLAHAAGALFVAVIEPVSLAVLAPPGAYGADIAAGEGQPLGIAPQYGGPYLGILASTDALVRQIPGRLVGHDHRPRREACLRHDHARARAGHPPRQGGQQHLHQPGAPRPRRVHLPGDDRPARVARRGDARCEPRRRARGRAGRGRRPSGSIPVRTSTSSPSASRTRAPSIAGCSTPASWPGSSSPTPSPTTRASSTASSCARRRSRPRPRSSAFAGPLSAVLGHTRYPGAGPMSVIGETLQPTLFERGRPGRGGGKIPHPPNDALDRIPAEARADGPAGAPRAERARRRPPLRQPLAAQLRGRHRVLSARLVHHEVQPEAQRVGRPPAGFREPAPAGAGRGRAGHAPVAVGARAAPSPRSPGCAR